MTNKKAAVIIDVGGFACICHSVFCTELTLFNTIFGINIHSASWEAYLAQQQYINEMQSLGLGFRLKEVIQTLIWEGAVPLPDDSISEFMHHVAGLREAHSIRGEIIQQVHEQQRLLVPFGH